MTRGQYQKQEELFQNLGECYSLFRQEQRDKAIDNAMKMVELINKTFAQDHFMNIMQKGIVANFLIQMEEYQPAGEILTKLIKTTETEQMLKESHGSFTHGEIERAHLIALANLCIEITK
jgi:hypothetical protein